MTTAFPVSVVIQCGVDPEIDDEEGPEVAEL
jgi:hypothetical protein